MNWCPIEDLPPNWTEMAHEDLNSLAKVWETQKQRLKDTQSFQRFNDQMRRQIAIETGVIERLYTIDRGTTRLLVEHGIDEALIPHGTIDKPASQVIALIRDHEQALERVFDFVGSQRSLSVSYIKQLHQLLTRNQEHAEAVDQFGKRFLTSLERGNWKSQPNNPLRPDGEIHEYCPPEQVASQMDQLIEWHLVHTKQNVSPEVEAAWFHHRFTQIHPFQDGNGRVARALASLIFIRAGWFPLVITRRDYNTEKYRAEYIEALEKADHGDLEPLVDFFARAQRQAFITSLSLSEDVLAEGETFQTALDSIINRLKKDEKQRQQEAQRLVELRAARLFEVASKRLTGVEREIKLALRQINKQTNVFTDNAPGKDSRRIKYYFREITEIARYFNYWAYFEYESWVRLAIEVDNLRTSILLSFHSLDRNNAGVLVCSALAFRKSLVDNDSDATPTTQDVEPLTQAPFQFTYLDEIDRLERDFTKWLEEALVVGLTYWRKSL